MILSQLGDVKHISATGNGEQIIVHPCTTMWILGVRPVVKQLGGVRHHYHSLSIDLEEIVSGANDTSAANQLSEGRGEGTITLVALIPQNDGAI